MKEKAVILFTNSPETDVELKTPSAKSALKSLVKNCFTESISHLYKKFNGNEYSLLVSSSENSLFDYLQVKKEKRIIQKGNTFGERFYNSIHAAFNIGFNKVAIIGNDATIIKNKRLLKALKDTTDNIACVGSSTNGGFYFLSLSQESFHNIPKQEFISLPYQTEIIYNDLIKLFNYYLIEIKILEKKKYFDCSKALLVVQKIKNLQFDIRSEAIKNSFATLIKNFRQNIFIVTNSLDFQIAFHKAPPLV